MNINEAIAGHPGVAPATIDEHSRLWAQHRDAVVHAWWRTAARKSDLIAIIVDGAVTSAGIDVATVVARPKVYDVLSCISERARYGLPVASIFGSVVASASSLVRPIIVVAASSDGAIDVYIREWDVVQEVEND